MLLNWKGLLSLLLLATTHSLLANTNPVELGKIHWERNFEAGLAKSKATQKPVFLLFQEVPGCSTCRNYGANILSHPLIVEAIETLFVPVAIHNNKKGADAEVLNFYREPSWNNPVVRIVKANKKDIIPRVNGKYNKLAVVQAMRLALETENLEVPTYLRLLEEELLGLQGIPASATFSMFCFWTGEKEIGKLDGVLETQAGFMNGREVVNVTYDPEVLAYNDLLKNASASKCASEVFTDDRQQAQQSAAILGKSKVAEKGTFRLDKDPKYYIGRTDYRHVPMTQLQAVKV
ncbi:MAG: VPGUxxT family thioredoxin-like (seleno)protein, type 2, partial [Bacteroidota bacterium]